MFCMGIGYNSFYNLLWTHPSGTELMEWLCKICRADSDIWGFTWSIPEFRICTGFKGQKWKRPSCGTSNQLITPHPHRLGVECAEVTSKGGISVDHQHLHFRTWCTLTLGGAIPPSSLLPFWLLQALSNWLSLGFARSSARLAASLWLHWITWKSSLRNNRLKVLQHFCTAPEFFLTFLESFTELICFLPW